MGKNLKNPKEARIGKISPSPHTCFVWSLLAALMIALMAGLKATGMFLAHNSLLFVIQEVTYLLILSFAYTHIRRDARIATMTHIIAVYLTITVITCIFSYPIAALGRPLVDDYLVTIDHAMGFDWLVFYKWVMAHPLIHKILAVVYLSIVPQVVMMILVLNFFGMATRCWEMMWLFIAACLTCLLFSVLWPAMGAFGYNHISAPYVDTFMALRNGSLKDIGVSSPLKGIIQFPSFHIELALIVIYAARSIRFLFPVLLAINSLLLISTLPIGGHHLTDVLGGILMTLLMILAMRMAFKPAAIVSIPATPATA